LNLPAPNRDQEQAPLTGSQVRGTHFYEERSARQYRSHSVAEFTAQYGDHHDPVCRIAGGGCGGSGAALEPLMFFKGSRGFRRYG
jgi:hypothetical protein